MISFLVILSYIIYCIWKNGIPHSLSSTFYDNGVWFSLAILLSAGFLFPSLINSTPDNLTLLPFLIFASICFVAFAPNFKLCKLEDNVHTTAAIISLIASQLWVLLLHPICLLWWIVYVIILFFDKSNYKFWGEVIMLLTLYSSLL